MICYFKVYLVLCKPPADLKVKWDRFNGKIFNLNLTFEFPTSKNPLNDISQDILLYTVQPLHLSSDSLQQIMRPICYLIHRGQKNIGKPIFEFPTPKKQQMIYHNIFYCTASKSVLPQPRADFEY